MKKSRANRSKQQSIALAGFTLIEITVVMAIIAILAALAAPNLTQLRVRNAVRASVNDFSLSMQFARAQAVQLNSQVTVCPSNDGVNCTSSNYEDGWIVRLGPATNATGQRILQDVLAKELVTITTNISGNRFTFLPNGGPRSGFAGGRVMVCPTISGMETLVKILVINRAGRINIEKPNECAFPT